MFSNETIYAIGQVSGMIAGDALEGFDEQEYGCTEAELLAEMTLDADRLQMNGYPEANEEIKGLLKTHTWVEVCKEAERYVCY